MSRSITKCFRFHKRIQKKHLREKGLTLTAKKFMRTFKPLTYRLLSHPRGEGQIQAIALAKLQAHDRLLRQIAKVSLRVGFPHAIVICRYL